MPSVSKAQRRLMAMALAYQKGKFSGKPSDTIKKLAKNMTKKDLKAFASTPETDLPEKIGEQINDEIIEVAPPGYEKVVKALKKNPNVDNPWALAWSMKKKGIKPKNENLNLIEIYKNIKKNFKK